MSTTFDKAYAAANAERVVELDDFRAGWQAALASVSAGEPVGWKLAMRVLQSDMYAQLDEAERAECDALVRANPHIRTSMPAASEAIPSASGGVVEAQDFGWTGHAEADNAIILLGRLDVSSDDDVRVDQIERAVRYLAKQALAADSKPASPATASPRAAVVNDAAIKACSLMVKGICMTRPQDTWAAEIEKRIRFMLAAPQPSDSATVLAGEARPMTTDHAYVLYMLARTTGDFPRWDAELRKSFASTAPAGAGKELTDVELRALIRKVEDKLGIVWFVPDDSETFAWRTTNTNEQDKFVRALLAARTADTPEASE
jgi:hypothetical protein